MTLKKKILLSILTVFIGFLAYQAYVFFIAPTDNLNSIYLIPKDAVYIVETQKPIDNWDDISKSDIWKHLQTNAYFKDLTKNLNKLDGIFSQQKKLVDFIGNRSILISAHMIKKKQYALFYVIDLQKLSKLNLLKNNLNSVINKSYKVSKRNYHNHSITEIYDKKNRETIYLSFIKNQMIASYTHTLVEASIDQFEEPIIGRNLDFIEISKKVGDDNLFRFYMQYQYLDDYLYYFTDQPNNMITAVSKSLMFSGFSFDLKSNNVMLANGFTNAKQNTASYLKALQKSGKGKRSIAKIAPKRTALYMSYAFDSFLEFYENFEIIQRENKAQFKTFQDNKDKIENYLKINIKDHFLSWIGTEIAVLQIQSSSISKSKNDVALVIKANNIKDAKSNLDFIVKQIRKRTPVKFKAINYKGFDINFLSIKGFFKVFLGSLFDQFEKPYYTIIDDYVVFSNHPNALKSIINDYIGEETLNKSKDFQKFNSYFDKKSSVFAYINTPVLYKNLYEYADRNTKSKIKKNKDYIICFPQVGFQLTPYINMFESKFVVNYIDPEVVKNKDQFKDLPIIGPTNDSNNNDNTNILEIEQRDIFNIRDIYPSDLNAKEYIKKFKNGKVRMKISLKNGQKNGAYREYHLNGEVKIKGRYKKDQQVGTWKAYDINGDLIKKKRF
jgi:hypothetical protein